MMNLRSKLIHVAHINPSLRAPLLPLLCPRVASKKGPKVFLSFDDADEAYNNLSDDLLTWEKKTKKPDSITRDDVVKAIKTIEENQDPGFTSGNKLHRLLGESWKTLGNFASAGLTKGQASNLVKVIHQGLEQSMLHARGERDRLEDEG